MPHVFISYVHEDSAAAQRLATALEVGGAETWLDRDRLTPGVRWQAAIRQAIEGGAFFIACFSEHSAARKSSYMNEELTIAIGELRKRPTDRAWFLPTLLSPGALPPRTIGAGETLRDIHYVELYDDWDRGVRALLTVIAPGRVLGTAAASIDPTPESATLAATAHLAQRGSPAETTTAHDLTHLAIPPSLRPDVTAIRAQGYRVEARGDAIIVSGQDGRTAQVPRYTVEANSAHAVLARQRFLYDCAQIGVELRTSARGQPHAASVGDGRQHIVYRQPPAHRLPGWALIGL